MQEFINALNELFETDFGTNDEDGNLYYTDEANEVISMCCEYLIGPNGTCNWDNINILKNHGYHVYAYEKDSFGWLIGAISKNGKKLLYG